MALAEVLMGLGGKLLSRLLAKRFGPELGAIADEAVVALAEAFNVAPEPAALEAAISKSPKAEAAAKVQAVEQRTAELVLAEAEKMRLGNEQQRQTNELLLTQLKAPGWRSDWLYAWQWFLMLAWLWTLILVQVLNALLRLFSGATDAVFLPAPDLGVLVTLTGLYLGLHMGGHTVLELVRNKWGGLFSRKDVRTA